MPQKLWVDSLDMVEHDQKSPHEWDVSLERVIHGVKSVSVLQLHVPTSPHIVVIRSSKWFQSTQDSADYDSFHTKAASLEADGFENSVVITTADGTANLHVHAVYTATETGASDDFRTFACFLCTGTNNNTGTSTWNLVDQDDTSSPFDFATDDGTHGVPQAAGEITISASVQPVDYFLKLKLNGSPMSATDSWSASHIAPRWHSYRWYRHGQIVSRPDVAARYECTKDHVAIVFANDLLSGLWKALPTDGTIVGGGRRPAEGSLLALTFKTENEDTVVQRTSASTYRHVFRTPVSVTQIGALWTDSTGNPVLFPVETELDVRDLDTGAATIALSRGHYKPHKMLLEFEV